MPHDVEHAFGLAHALAQGRREGGTHSEHATKNQLYARPKRCQRGSGRRENTRRGLLLCAWSGTMV